MSSCREEADEIFELAYYENVKVLVWGPGEPDPGASVETKNGASDSALFFEK